MMTLGQLRKLLAAAGFQVSIGTGDDEQTIPDGWATINGDLFQWGVSVWGNVQFPLVFVSPPHTVKAMVTDWDGDPFDPEYPPTSTGVSLHALQLGHVNLAWLAVGVNHG